jgi:membrane-bound lytic murein transglycosylase B
MILPFAFALIVLCSCVHHEKSVKQEPIPRLDLAIVNSSASSEQCKNEVAREFVENLLVNKGLDRTNVHKLLCDPRIVIDKGFIVKSLIGSAPTASTSSSKYMYYNPQFISKGRAFIEGNQDAFANIHERYGVSPEIVTAILIIETKLGTYEGKYRAFDVFVNISLANDPEVIAVLKGTYGNNYPELFNENNLEKLRARGRWALNELCALIQLSDKLQLDPIEIKGSIAGAIGPAQFIPTSFIKFGVAGNLDERIDPFRMDDAIASIANYLKLAGWTDSGSDKADHKKRTAIWIYNHHEIYVNTVMKLYNELRTAGFNEKLTKEMYSQ